MHVGPLFRCVCMWPHAHTQTQFLSLSVAAQTGPNDCVVRSKECWIGSTVAKQLNEDKRTVEEAVLFFFFCIPSKYSNQKAVNLCQFLFGC